MSSYDEKTSRQGFLNSLASTFKPSNGDRNKIDASSISTEPEQQDLFNKVRSGSLSSRANAVEMITRTLYEYNVSSIPEIWYCARDLISPNVQHSIRRIALHLLIKCVELDKNDAVSQYAYYKDAIHNCHFTKVKVDSEFDLFLKLYEMLTENGTFVHLYQEDFKKLLLQMFFNALSANELSKNKNVLDLMKFLINCTKYGLFNDRYDENQDKIETKDILILVIRLSLKTSDSEVLEQCIQFFNAIINFKTIPDELLYETVCVLCGAAVLNLRFFDLASEVTNTLMNMTTISGTFKVLNDVIKNNDNNTNSVVGAIQIMSSILPSHVSQVDMNELLHSLDLCIGWNKDVLIVSVLKFMKDTLLNDIVINQLGDKYWKSEPVPVIQLLCHCYDQKLDTEEKIETFRSVLSRLQMLVDSSIYPGRVENLARFFIYSDGALSKQNSMFVLNYFQSHNLCSPLHPSWKENITLISNTFYLDNSKNVDVRTATLKLLMNTFESSLNIFRSDFDALVPLLNAIFQNLDIEENKEVLKDLSGYLADILVTVKFELYKFTINTFVVPSLISERKERRSSLAALGSIDHRSKPTRRQFSKETAKLVTKSMVRVSAKTLLLDGEKSVFNYDLLIRIAQTGLSNRDVDLLLITSRFLVRIRQSTEDQLYITNPTDMDGLSAAFERNLIVRKAREVKPEGSGVQENEKWTYPEDIEYIPDEVLNKPSEVISFHNPNSNELPSKPTINIDQWLNIVIGILDGCPHWEIYSFIWAHICPQLSNIKLFQNSAPGICSLRTLLCEQLSLKLPTHLKIPENITKHNLQVAILRNFTPLVAYHEFFSKQEEDQIISSLIFGLSSWEKTAIPCVHILTVCCYEIPLSIKKYLSVILTKLQIRISSAFASAHILEFLLSLSYIPNLTSNFTVDEFKRAFGITFKLIQCAHDIRKLKDNQHQGILAHGEELEAEKSPSTTSVEITPVISIYLLSLSYDVIANWYLNMKINDRRQLTSFIMKNLILSEANPDSSLSNQNIAFLDLISRFTYSNLELSFGPISPQQFPPEAPILSSKWVHGWSILAIDTHAETGESIVTVRRPSATTVFRITPDESMIPLYTNQLHSKDEDDLFTENYILLQLLFQVDTHGTSSKPIPIPTDDLSIARSISNFDRIPVVEYHKVGLLYIGPNQTTEAEIFGNTNGSAAFDEFLSVFGRRIKLKNCKSFYVGGLDTNNDADGEYAYAWNDKILQMIYHTTTLMPNQDEDSNFSAKKKHVGNNYVNIFFDESGHPFDFNIIKSQFNFLNIVIEPHSKSFKNDSQDSERYRVKIHRRSGVPALFATCHFKIVSKKNLPTFVRTLALVADQFAKVWHSNGESSSNGSFRMNQINNIKEKSIGSYNKLKKKKQEKNTTENSQQSSTGQSFLDQLSNASGNENSGISRNNSIKRLKNNQYDFLEDDDNEVFTNMEFTSFTR